VAKADIKIKEIICHVPLNLILTPGTASLPEEYIKDMKHEDPERDYWLRIILSLMYEKALGQNSRWAAYLTTLPTTFDTPIFWTENELKELQACYVRQQIGREEMDALFEEYLVPVISAHPEEFGIDADNGGAEKIIEFCHQSGSTVMAYSFTLQGPCESKSEPKVAGTKRKRRDDVEEDDDDENDDEWGPIRNREINALVPLADTLNGDLDNNVGSIHHLHL
jgi:hypothetical protein